MTLSPEQIEFRRGGLGSSDIAALTGHSTWASPWDVWRSKVEGVEKPQDFKMELGQLLEPVVLELFRRRTGRLVGANAVTYQHPELKFALSTPDGLTGERHGVREDAVVEAKTCDPFAMEEFGEDGTDQVKPAYMVQAVWHMGVLRGVLGESITRCFIPVLFGTREFRLYEVGWDPEMWQNLVTIGRSWWETYVLPRKAPPIDASSACTAHLADAFPANREPLRLAERHHHEWATELRQLKATMAVTKDRVDYLANEMRSSIADAEGLEGEGWRATWRADKRGKRAFRLKFKNEGESADE